ncbi:hypothetical protein DRN75_04285 [Nanoarchaeota archaeon]|nr:MAG: hypothetical protein DRN75_04285 [Nanoarchaeota archaeon]
MSVFVTNTDYKHGLAAVRALGAEGVAVYCGSSRRFNPSALSRYCKKAFYYRDEKSFVSVVSDAVNKYNIEVLLPVGYNENIWVSKHKDEFNTRTLISDYKLVSSVANKDKLYTLAKKHKIPIPRTLIVRDVSKTNISKLKYPVVVKSAVEGSPIKVSYAWDEQMLRTVLKQRLSYGPQIIQEYVRGPTYGFFSIAKDGKVLVYFQHKRLREFPSTGGVSSKAMSVYSPDLETVSKRFLRRLNWTGVSMLEFKYDEDSEEFKLIEMNPKFWGSLDLAITCGVNFPYLAYRAALGYKITQPKYKVGVTYQWMLPEDLLSIKTHTNKLRALKDVLKDALNNSINTDIEHFLYDPLPTAARMLWSTYKYITFKPKDSMAGHKVDLHVHTKCSHDSTIHLKLLLNKARRLGFGAIAITDHNSIRCALAAKKLSKKYKVDVIVGEEISTDKGDIIGLFIKKYIPPGKFSDVIKNIRAQGGLVYLPHPYSLHEDVELLAKLSDVIEVCNGRLSGDKNRRAMELAKRHGKLMAAGSDSHFLHEFGATYGLFAQDPIHQFEFFCSQTSILTKGLSSFVSGIKTRDVSRVLRVAKNGALLLLGKYRRDKNEIDTS